MSRILISVNVDESPLMRGPLAGSQVETGGVVRHTRNTGLIRTVSLFSMRMLWNFFLLTCELACLTL